MKMIYVAIYDKVSKTYNNLFPVQSIEVLRRDLEDVINKGEIPHWIDKSVVEFVEFDVSDGSLIQLEKKSHDLIDWYPHIYKKQKEQAHELKKELLNEQARKTEKTN